MKQTDRKTATKAGMEIAMQSSMPKQTNFAVIMLIGPIVLMFVVHLYLLV